MSREAEITCPYCNSILTKKEGKRRIKREIVQKYRCLECNKYFSDKKLGHKSYPPKIILTSVSFFNQGYTLEETKKLMAKRFKTKLSVSTINSWTKSYSNICTYQKLRGSGKTLFQPDEIIFSHKLQHKQVYNFQLHRAKLELLKNNILERKFIQLKNYLEKIPTNDFPHHIFSMPSEEDIEQRASQIKMELLKITKLEKQNNANLLAELALKICPDNKARHETIQNFMITNDSVTIAVEVPVYLTNDDIEYFKSKRFTFDFENYRTPITGHIDVLQIRNNLIHILDYKPEAEKVKPIDQLTIYTLALASRTKLAIKDFKCAWFDNKNYFEFFPLVAT